MALELFGMDTLAGSASEGALPIRFAPVQVEMVFTIYHRTGSDSKKTIVKKLLPIYTIPDILSLAVVDPRFGGSNKLFSDASRVQIDLSPRINMSEGFSIGEI